MNTRFLKNKSLESFIIDVDPAFPPEIRGVSDADLASTSAESPQARRPCVQVYPPPSFALRRMCPARSQRAGFRNFRG